MNRILMPLLFLLAGIPETDEKLENINAILTVTRESVKSIKSGMETFHATMAPLMMPRTEKEDRK